MFLNTDKRQPDGACRLPRLPLARQKGLYLDSRTETPAPARLPAFRNYCDTPHCSGTPAWCWCWLVLNNQKGGREQVLYSMITFQSFQK